MEIIFTLISISIISICIATHMVYGMINLKDKELNKLLLNSNEVRLNRYNNRIIAFDNIVIVDHPFNLLTKYHIQSGYKRVRIARWHKCHKTIKMYY
jgi:hypothetical protein